MNKQSSQHPYDTSLALDESVKRQTHPSSLAFPTTLAGTWPAPHDMAQDTGHRAHALHQVQALDAVKTSTTALCQQALRSMQSTDAEPSARLPSGRPDSQGRMDLLTMMAEKVKDFVNPGRTRETSIDGPIAKVGH